jgi:hypothetical protein
MSGAAMGTEQLQWHDASQRKPDSDITVLCWLEPGGEWFSGWWGEDEWFDAATGAPMDGVTHWAEPEGPDARVKAAGPPGPVEP